MEEHERERLRQEQSVREHAARQFHTKSSATRMCRSSRTKERCGYEKWTRHLLCHSSLRSPAPSPPPRPPHHTLSTVPPASSSSISRSMMPPPPRPPHPRPPLHSTEPAATSSTAPHVLDRGDGERLRADERERLVALGVPRCRYEHPGVRFGTCDHCQRSGGDGGVVLRACSRDAVLRCATSSAAVAAPSAPTFLSIPAMAYIL